MHHVAFVLCDGRYDARVTCDVTTGALVVDVPPVCVHHAVLLCSVGVGRCESEPELLFDDILVGARGFALQYEPSWESDDLVPGDAALPLVSLVSGELSLEL